MTKEEKELLLKDLCARLPYGVHVVHSTNLISGKLNDIHMLHLYHGSEIVQDVICTARFLGEDNADIIYLIPLLRSMSSMTDDEHDELFQTHHDAEMKEVERSGDYLKASMIGDMAKYDWLNQHHFDYRGLIEKGIAIEVPKSYYFD